MCVRGLHAPHPPPVTPGEVQASRSRLLPSACGAYVLIFALFCLRCGGSRSLYLLLVLPVDGRPRSARGARLFVRLPRDGPAFLLPLDGRFLSLLRTLFLSLIPDLLAMIACLCPHIFSIPSTAVKCSSVSRSSRLGPRTPSFFKVSNVFMKIPPVTHHVKTTK